MAKRGNGEGSVYQRADGQWCGSVSLQNGKRRTLYGTTRKEAADKLAAALRDAQQGIPIPLERQTVGQFLGTWLEDTARPTIRASTFRGYSDIVTLHLVPELGKVPLAK